MNDTDKIIECGRLYDYYGRLLTDHQRRIYEKVVYDDLSLSEIAEQEQISKQAVSDLVKRCSLQLEKYERELGCVRQSELILKELSEMDEILRQDIRTESSGAIQELHQCLERIRETITT